MTYNKVIAYIPDTSVLFELDNGNYALVAVDVPAKAKYVITVSKYAESHLKFGGFEDAKNIPKETLQKAVRILEKGEKVYLCKDLKLK